MRGAARIGGRGFRPTPSKSPQAGSNPLEALIPIGDLPVAPALEPINDDWSWSLGAKPADPRDCSRYPASPYCGEIPASQLPIGYDIEFRTNGCETCMYIYPVILFLKLTPQVICKRDPNCKPPAPDDNPPPIFPQPNIPEFPEEPPTSECIKKRNKVRRRVNQLNRQTAARASISEVITGGRKGSIRITRQWEMVAPTDGLTSFWIEEWERVAEQFTSHYVWREATITYPATGTDPEFVHDTRWDSEYVIGLKFPPCPPEYPDPPQPPPPPPPFNDRPPQNRKNGKDKDMCCNECADAKDNTDKLLKEIKEIKKALGTGKLAIALDAAVGIGDSSLTAIVNLIAKRIGVDDYPIEVPASLLSDDHDDKTYKLQSNAEYLFWLTTQIDKLVGEFPIDIEVKDSDPIKAGDQPMKIRIPNIAEAIAEIYGLTFKSSVNQEVELNMLLRLALETTHAKNAAIIAQDYARGNAKFLGYQGNTKGRHVDYNFDFTDVNASEKDQNKQLNLESLLKNSKAWIQGWENDDSETAVNFLRKLMFSAGIVKSVFFRNKTQSEAVVKNIAAMQEQVKVQDADWVQFLKDINDPNSKYNVGSTEKPDINEDKSK